MTTEQEKSIIGGVVLEYNQVKQRLAALHSEFYILVHASRNAETALNGLNSSESKIEEYLDNWPTADQWRANLAETKEKRARLQQLEVSMKSFGLEIK